MKRTDKLILGLIFGSIPPLLLFMSSVVVWFYFFQKLQPLVFAFSGVVVGLLINLVYLKRLIKTGFDLPVWFLICTYLFYNLVLFGFFMGVPVFNLIAGIVAAYYFGKRIVLKNIPVDGHTRISRQVSLFTASVMFLICAASAILATVGHGAGKELGPMFRLPVEVTETMVWEIILVGGFTLIVFQYFVTMAVLSRILNTPKNRALNNPEHK